MSSRREPGRRGATGPYSGAVHRREVGVCLALLALGMSAFALFARDSGLEGAHWLGASLVFAVLFLPYPTLSVGRWADRLGAWIRLAPGTRLAALLAAPAVAYLVYNGALGALEPSFIWKYAAYVGLPGALTVSMVRAGKDPLEAPLRMTAIILALWLPLDLRLLPPFRVPAGGPESLNLMRLAALDAALVLFVAAAPVRDLGFTFRLALADAGKAVVALAAFTVVAIPLGLATGFIAYGWRPFDAIEWTLLALNIYFFVGVPEEFLFRGLIQNLIERRWPWPRPGLAALTITALVFGAAHLNNGPAPNYRYALIAALAGVAYGWVWMRTRRVTAAAVTHGAVDWIWVLAFRA